MINGWKHNYSVLFKLGNQIGIIKLLFCQKYLSCKLKIIWQYHVNFVDSQISRFSTVEKNSTIILHLIRATSFAKNLNVTRLFWKGTKWDSTKELLTLLLLIVNVVTNSSKLKSYWEKNFKETCSLPDWVCKPTKL